MGIPFDRKSVTTARLLRPLGQPWYGSKDALTLYVADLHDAGGCSGIAEHSSMRVAFS